MKNLFFYSARKVAFWDLKCTKSRFWPSIQFFDHNFFGHRGLTFRIMLFHFKNVISGEIRRQIIAVAQISYFSWQAPCQAKKAFLTAFKRAKKVT